MKSKLMMMALPGALLGMLFSCAAQPDRGTAQNTYARGGAADELDEVIGDRWLHSQLVMEDVLTRRTEDRLRVQFGLHNTGSRNLPFEWTLVWFDEGGFKLDFAEHWTPVVIGGKGFETLTRTAPSPAAAAFRLGLREPNTVH